MQQYLLIIPPFLLWIVSVRMVLDIFEPHPFKYWWIKYRVWSLIIPYSISIIFTIAIPVWIFVIVL